MDSEHKKSVLEEIRGRFFGKAAQGIYIPRKSQEIMPRMINAMNLAGVEIVRRYVMEREIEIGVPVKDCISIYNAPIDILPFIPLFFDEISEHGKYTVMQWIKPLGRRIYHVTYDGMPEQDEPGTAIIGVKTIVQLEQMPEELEINLIYDGGAEQMQEEAELKEQEEVNPWLLTS